MSEINLTDRISETITNAFKKTEIFGKFQLYVNSFLIITSIIGVTNIYMNTLTNFDIHNIKEEIQGNENVLKYHIEINRKRNLIEHCNLKSEILILNKQLSLLLENQEKIINQLEEMKLIKISEQNKLSINISKIDCISASTSMTTFSPIKIPSVLDESIVSNVTDDNKDKEYDELLNECYDAIPLNNLKKTTGLSWLFK
jgi:hypothetical protein